MSTEFPVPLAVDAIVTAPEEPVVIVIFDPAIRYDDPSDSLVSEPDRLPEDWITVVDTISFFESGNEKTMLPVPFKE